MNFFSVMLDLRAQLVILVGGGAVAFRRAEELLRCGAQVRVISPVMAPEIVDLFREWGDSLVLVEREFRSGDTKGASLIFAMTDNREVNGQVLEEARGMGIPVNVADDPESCSFFVNSTKHRGDLSWSISTNGKSPAMAARLSREFGESLPQGIEEILKALGDAREILKEDEDFSELDSSQRGNLLRKIVHSKELLLEIKEKKDIGELKLFLRSLL